jgi:hypothetical protein
MELTDLTSAVFDELRPRARKLAVWHPAFVERVLRRLVERAPSPPSAPFFEDELDRDDFVADISLELAGQPMGGIGPFWLMLLMQVLLPALIRAFLLWWNRSPEHRMALVELRRRLDSAETGIRCVGD